MYKFNKALVYKGRAVQIAVCLVDEQGNQLPTAGLTASYLRIENGDGSFIKKLAATGFTWGVVEQTYMHVYAFSTAETAIFKNGNDKSVWLELDYTDNVTKYELKKFITVLDEVF